MSDRYKNLILCLVSVIFSLLLLELFSYQLIRSNSRRHLDRDDESTGWSPAPNVNINLQLESFKNRKYSADYSTDSLGLRSIAHIPFDRSPSNQTLLVIGDSFTAEVYSSNNQAWHAQLNQKFGYNVYAYGISGSGTAQQFKAFKRLAKHNIPRILIIQFCSNDILNDYPPFISNTSAYTQAAKTVYYQNSEFFNDQSVHAILYRFASRFSLLKLASEISVPLIIKVRSELLGHQISPPDLYSDQETILYDSDDAKQNWINIYSDYVSYARSIGVDHVWSISCRSAQEVLFLDSHKIWINASKKLDVHTFQSPADSVITAENQGIDVRYIDGSHWSDIGSTIAGKSLLKDIQSHLFKIGSDRYAQ